MYLYVCMCKLMLRRSCMRFWVSWIGSLSWILKKLFCLFWFCCFTSELCNILKRFFFSEGACKNRAEERWWILSRWWSLWLLWKLDVWYHRHESVQRRGEKGSRKKEKNSSVISFSFLFPSAHFFLPAREEICCHGEFCLEFEAFTSHNIAVAWALAPCRQICKGTVWGGSSTLAVQEQYHRW